MKRKTAASIAVALGMAGALVAVPQMSAAQPMYVAMQQEAAMHPHIVKAIRESEDALHELQTGASNFGGRKAEAMVQLQRAIHSMRAALFYRLRVDNATIDQFRF